MFGLFLCFASMCILVLGGLLLLKNTIVFVFFAFIRSPKLSLSLLTWSTIFWRSSSVCKSYQVRAGLNPVFHLHLLLDLAPRRCQVSNRILQSHIDLTSHKPHCIECCRCHFLRFSKVEIDVKLKFNGK